jgi:hypothetical protein
MGLRFEVVADIFRFPADIQSFQRLDALGLIRLLLFTSNRSGDWCPLMASPNKKTTRNRLKVWDVFSKSSLLTAAIVVDEGGCGFILSLT